jgi:hypothetical protein
MTMQPLVQTPTISFGWVPIAAAADPRSGAGLSATPGTVVEFSGTYYKKTGTGDTEWLPLEAYSATLAGADAQYVEVAGLLGDSDTAWEGWGYFLFAKVTQPFLGLNNSTHANMGSITTTANSGVGAVTYLNYGGGSYPILAENVNGADDTGFVKFWVAPSYVDKRRTLFFQYAMQRATPTAGQSAHGCVYMTNTDEITSVRIGGVVGADLKAGSKIVVWPSNNPNWSW